MVTLAGSRVAYMLPAGLHQPQGEAGDAQHAAIAPSVGVGLRRTRRVAGRWRMQAQVLVVCKVGAAHSLAALTSYLAAFAAAAVWLLPLLLLLPLPLLLLGWLHFLKGINHA